VQDRGWYDLPTYMGPSRSSGMLLIIPTDGDKPVGHVAAVINTNSTGWVSMFIVDSAYRGLGLGRELLSKAMQDFRSHGTKIVGLDAVGEQKKTYERRGFVESNVGVLRFMKRPLVAKESIHASVELTVTSSTHVVSLDSIPHHLLIEHELKYTGFERRGLWNDKHTFGRPDVQGWALVSKLKPESTDDIYAWSMIRRCSSGARIGPVYAKDAETAKVVLALTTKAVTASYIQSVPMQNEPMSSWEEARINDEASLVAEVWTGNAEAHAVFEGLGWRPAGVDYHRMWLDGKATEAQSEGGLAAKGLFAVFDAAIG